MIVLSFTHHSSLRIAELGLALIVVAGVALLLGALVPLGRKPASALAGLALAAGAVLMVVAIHFGRFG